MQAWDSFLVKDSTDSPYKGTAGRVVSVNREAGSVAGLMDLDGATVSFKESELQRLG
jgi:hypothetical protein